MNKKDRDAVMNQIGRELYGNLWVCDELTTSEWTTARRYDRPTKQRRVANKVLAKMSLLERLDYARKFSRAGRLSDPVTLPRNINKAAYAAKACFRSQASDFQNAQIFRWVHEQGIDLFDAKKLQTWFQKTFGKPAGSPTSTRKAAVRKLLKTGARPGRGGMSWKEFERRIRKDCNAAFNIKTLKRDVKEIRGR